MIGADGRAEWIVPAQSNRADLEALFGPAPDANSVLVVDARTREGTWVPRASAGDIIVGFGAEGDGFVYSGPDNCAPPDVPLELPETPERAPAPLFPDSQSACADGPRSGTWRADIGPSQIEGCPAMMKQAFAQSGAALTGGIAAPGKLSFACPFHPDTLELSRTARVRWTADGPNRWRTEDLGAEAFAAIPQGQGGGSHIAWIMTLVSPEEITFERRVEIVLPAAAAAMMGASADGCRITGTDRWTRTGD